MHGELIKKIRHEQGLNQQQFGNLIGVSGQYISKVEKGLNKLNIESLKLIEQKLGISISQEEICKIPFIVINTDGDCLTEENNCITISKSELGESDLDCKNMLCTRINGDSMNPEIHDKDVLIIDADKKSLIDGEIYILNYENQIYCKKVLLNINQIILKSFNPEYPPVTIEGQDKEKLNIIGRVIYQLRKRN